MKTAIYRLFILFSLFVLFSNKVLAATSCTSSISHSSVQTDSVTDFTFSVTNTSSVPLIYVRLDRPSENFSLVNIGIEGWNVSSNSEFAELSGGSIAVSDTLNFNFRVNAGSTEASSANWSLQVYGDGFENCSGSLGTSISGNLDVVPPSISDYTISGLTNTEAVISWTTDEPTETFLEHGTDSNYGSVLADATLKTSHSVSMSSLTSNTIYHFYVKATDEAGNFSYGSDGEFATPGYAETVTVTQTITNTVTVQATPSPAKTKTIIIRDTTKPVVAITSDIGGVYTRSPTIKGKAYDSKGVMRVHYSVDGGRNWLPVDELIGEEKPNATFSFTPLGLLDGNYEIIVRAYDPTANIGFSDSYEIVIDRLPPRVGSTLMTIGPQTMKPTSTGLVYGLQGINQGIILSSVGGATSIDLISDSILSSKVLGISSDIGMSRGQQMYSLSKNTETGLWYGMMNFSNPGLYQIVARAEDGANNKTERELQAVYVLPNGKIFSKGEEAVGVEVKVFVKNPNTNRFVVWDGEAFLQKNPQTTDNKGKYGLILPPGEYYLEAFLAGHKLLRTPIFNLTDHTPINTDFSLEKLTTFIIFGREFYLPTWKKTVVPVSIKQEGNEYMGRGSDLIGGELPFFILKQGDTPLYSSDLVGKPTIVSFLTTWSPLASEQMKVLDSLKSGGIRTVAIFEQETLSGVSLFMKRGRYETEVWADEDGELVEDFSIYTTPTHLFIDSKGMVRDVVMGFLDGEEMIEKLYE